MLFSSTYAFDKLFHREGSIAVVCSPLITLIKDQVSRVYTRLVSNRPCKALTMEGMPAVCIPGLESQSTICLQA